MRPDGLAVTDAPAELAVQVRSLGHAALGGIDGAEAADQTVADGALRDLARAVPLRAVMRRRQGQLHVFRQRRARLVEDVKPDVPVRVLERPVVAIALDRHEGLERVPRGRQEGEVALRVEAPAGDLERVLLDEVPGDEVERPRRAEVTELDEVGALVRLEHLDRLGDQEVQVRVALPVRVAPQVDGQPVDEEGEVGAVVGVEPAKEVLLGLAAALVLVDDEPRDQAQDVGRPCGRSSKCWPGMSCSEDAEIGGGAVTTRGGSTSSSDGAGGSGALDSWPPATAVPATRRMTERATPRRRAARRGGAIGQLV